MEPISKHRPIRVWASHTSLLLLLLLGPRHIQPSTYTNVTAPR